MIRQRLLLFGLSAVSLAGLGMFGLLWPRSAITFENAQKIHECMTLAEVERWLGTNLNYEPADSLALIG